MTPKEELLLIFINKSLYFDWCVVMECRVGDVRRMVQLASELEK